MATIDELVVEIKAEVDDFKRDMKSARQEIDETGESAGDAGGALENDFAGGVTAATAAIGLTVTAAAAAVSEYKKFTAEAEAAGEAAARMAFEIEYGVEKTTLATREQVQARMAAIDAARQQEIADTAVWEIQRKMYVGIAVLADRLLGLSSEMSESRRRSGELEGAYNSLEQQLLAIDTAARIAAAGIAKFNGVKDPALANPDKGVVRSFGGGRVPQRAPEVKPEDISTFKENLLQLQIEYDAATEKLDEYVDGLQALAHAHLDAIPPMQTMGETVKEQKAALADFVNFAENQGTKIKGTFEGMSADISGAISSAVASFAQAIGELIVGESQFENAGQAILNVLGNLAQQIGGILIAMGVAIKLSFSNPLAAIGAGFALVAAGAAISAATSNAAGEFGGGGFSGGSYGGGFNGGYGQGAAQVYAGGSQTFGVTLRDQTGMDLFDFVEMGRGRSGLNGGLRQ